MEDNLASKGDKDNVCLNGSSEIDAFLYGVPGGFLIAGLVLLCYTMFRNALTIKNQRRAVPSMSSNTRVDKKYLLGRKNKRGPPPSQDLRPMDVNEMALRDDAPDDIRAVAAAKVTKQHEQQQQQERPQKMANKT